MAWFKNLRIRMKMIVSFGLVIVFMMGLSFFAINRLQSVEGIFNYAIAHPIRGESLLLELRSEIRETRRILSSIVMYAPTNDKERIDSLARDGLSSLDRGLLNLDAFDEGMRKDPRVTQELIDAILGETSKFRLYVTQYKNEVFGPVVTLAQKGDHEGALEYTVAAAAVTNDLLTNLNDLLENVRIAAEIEVNNARADVGRAEMLLAIAAAIAVIISIVSALYISSLISEVRYMAKALNQLGTKGDLVFDEEIMKSAEKCSAWQDEIGDCARSFGLLTQHMAEIEGELARIASGDLSVDINVVSERDSIGLSMAKAVVSFNSMFAEIHAATDQVTAGAKQIADGAQSLAQGASEQAATTEELSSSVTEIADKTNANAKLAERAAALANMIKNNAEKGSGQMDAMMSAVQDINQASQSIGRVIKVIDDIAFQTNILALNAAVEAARAGQHGKGFAVVAEEVRNLAAKSAEAAKDTGALIEDSIEKSNFGVRIAEETSASFSEIVSGINESSQLVGEIAKLSEEQSRGIAHINTGIDQVALVVQQSSATAEESAAASEEMSSQSAMLQQLISQFKLKS